MSTRSRLKREICRKRQLCEGYGEFQKRFGTIKQLLPLGEGDITICSPSMPRVKKSSCLPSNKGNNCIL